MKNESNTLRDTAQQMVLLAEKLEQAGNKPLTSHEKQLIRVAYVPDIQENLALLLTSFLQGGFEQAEYHINELDHIIRSNIGE